MAQQILITKQSGEQQVFSADKLIRSLQNAGARSTTIDKIVVDIAQWIYPGVTTKQIYRRAHSLLHKEDKDAFRYRLKAAMYELGPTGYPFEFLLGEIYRRQGWEVQVGQVLQGASVTHEMDVIATKNGVQELIECKYHKDQGKQVSVQVSLYVRSRVNDIVEYRQQLEDYKALDFVAGVATNTRFSHDAMHYGEYAGLKLLSWDYPAGKGLKDLVEQLYIYPVTILKDLTLKDKQYLLQRKVVLCYQLDAQPELLVQMGLTVSKQNRVRKELAQIAKSSPFF